MRVIEPSELWDKVRLPAVPDGQAVLEGLSDAENAFLNAALEVLRLIEKPQGLRRSTAGLNRIARNRFPEWKWEIGDVECIAHAWKIAGLPSLGDAIRGARKLPAHSGRVSYIRPKLRESAAIQIDDRNVLEAFRCTESVVKAASVTQSEWFVYRVAAITNYGRYMFDMLGIEPPSSSAVERLCISHNSNDSLKSSHA